MAWSILALFGRLKVGNRRVILCNLIGTLIPQWHGVTGRCIRHGLIHKRGVIGDSAGVNRAVVVAARER
jgi:hypothetical protein